MVFSQFTKSLFTGQFEEAFGWALVDSEHHKGQEESKARQRAEVARRLALGIISPADAKRFLTQIDNELYTQAFHNDVESPLQAIPEHVSETVDTVVKTVKNPFPAIPIAWFVIAAIALFLWMGGLQLLKGILKK